jgi:hypothetical protein
MNDFREWERKHIIKTPLGEYLVDHEFSYEAPEYRRERNRNGEE